MLCCAAALGAHVFPIYILCLGPCASQRVVIPAKAGIQEFKLDAPVSSTGQAYQVRHDS
jgi:hypothetical protein